MGLAETAQLIVNLTMKDGLSGPAKTAAGGLSGLQKVGLGVATVMGGALTKGALQAEDAQGKFMAATGKTRVEAAKFVTGMDSLAGSLGATGVSFEDLAETGTMVEQQFGTTGQATTDLTENILEFSKVTGQDAADAAADLEDALSAFGLEADDATGLMDQLVASSQEYGTDAGPAAVDALNNMAPALTAMGMGLDDGIELLNAFEVAGGDAGDATKGLQTAVAQLKPGENIDDLITKIAAIEDPLLKNQAAVDAFGKKMGPELAKLIKPGMTSLDDFGVSAEDAAGSVRTAAGDMQTTSEKIRGVFEQIGAGAREMGQEFGPAISSMAAIAPALLAGAKAIHLDEFAGVIKDKAIEALSGLWEGISKKLGGSAAEAAGGALGEVFGDAVGDGAGEAIAEGAAGTIGGNLSADAIKKAAGESGMTVGKAFGAAMILGATVGVGALLTIKWLDAIQEAKTTIENDPGSLGSVDLFQARAPMWAKAKISVQQQMQAMSQEALIAFNLEWNKGIAAGLSPQAALEPARQAGLAIGDAGAQGINEGIAQGVILGPPLPAGWLAEKVLPPATKSHLAEEAKDTIGMAVAVMMNVARDADQVTRTLADGLLQGLPSVHQAWDQFVTATKNALNPMKEIAWLEGRLGGERLANALASKNPLVREQARQMQTALMSQLTPLQQLMGTEGAQGSNALGANLNPGPAVAAAQAIMRRLAAIFDHQFHVGVTANLGGEHGYSGGGRASGGPVVKGVPYLINENTAKSEYFIPGVSGYVAPHNQVQWGGGVQPIALQINLQSTVVLAPQTFANSTEHYRRTQGGQIGTSAR